MHLTDARTVLKQLPPGTAIYTRERIDVGNREIAWLVREESDQIGRLGRSPIVEFRAGGIEQSAVFLLAVLLRVGPQAAESIYETWINAHAVGQSNPLENLAKQPRIVVYLFNGEGCRLQRTLEINNQLQQFAAQALDKLREFTPWSMQLFGEARERVYRDYPNVWTLWQALSTHQK